MSYEIKVLTCGTVGSIEDAELCFPITRKIIYDPTKIKPYIARQSKSIFFIIVFLHLFGQTIELLLAEIGDKKNIIGIYFCVDHIYNSLNNQANVFHLSTRLLTCKTTSLAIRSYEYASQRFYQTCHEGLAYILEQTSNNLKRWLSTGDKVKACDVLLIPLNTDDANLYDLQQQFIEFCSGLCDDFEPRVCTLHDFISPNESSSTMSKEDQAFVNEQNKIICFLIQKLAPIRIYVWGNGECISNNWSKLMIENEPDNSDQAEPQYDQRCTFVENEPVNIDNEPLTRENEHKLRDRYCRSWKIKNIMPIRLDNKIRNDGYFLTALDRSHATSENREMIANRELSLWAMNYHENSNDYSSEFHTIKEAENVLTEPNTNGTEEINNTIQYYRMNSSNGDNNNQ